MIEQGISVVISARNEFPNLPHTINSLMLDMEGSGFNKWEILVADNASHDNTTRFFTYAWADAYAKTSDTQHIRELRPSGRGLLGDGRLRFCHDPLFSNVGARHRAVEYARYENLIFADGHIAVKHGTIKYVMETLNKYGGLIHTPVSWSGSSCYRPRAGMQYTYKIGEKFFSTWNFAQCSDQPFYIAVSGHCFFAVKKKEYLAMGGYDCHQQIYGGGENYLDSVYWMLGSNVMVDPRALVYHLSAGRGYCYDMVSLIHNMMMTAYALGGFKWSERVLIAYLNKPGTDHEYIKEIYKKAIEDGKEKHDFIASKQIMTLDEMLGLNRPHDCDGSCRGEKYKGTASHTRRIWDIKNDELHGKHLSFVQVFDDWLTRLTDGEAISLYKNSPYQK